MSRTATATPPPPLFQQKTATPSMRHASKGNQRVDPQCGFQRHFKKPPKSSLASVSQTSPLKETVVPMSASDMLGMAPSKSATPDPMATATTSSISWREDDTDAASIATSVPSMSGGSTSSDAATLIVTPETTPSSSIYGDNSEVPSSTSSASTSYSSIPAAPSPRSWVNGFGKTLRAAGIINPFSRRREGESPRISASPAPIAASPLMQASPVSPYIAPSPASIAPSSALVSPMAFTITPAPEVTDLLDNPLPPHALPAAVAHPHNMPPALTPDSPNIDNPAEALRRYEWSEAQRRQVTEFARLCSQWPQSSYNLSKFPPGTQPQGQYVPQSWANPRHVVRTMQRQSDLERQLCESGGTFHPCRSNSTRSSSTDVDSLGSAPSAFSSASRQSSLATTVSLGAEDPLCDAVWATTKKVHGPEATEPKTAAALRAAMSSPLVEAWRGEASIISVSSVSSVASIATSADESKTSSAWASLANSTKSLSELDKMAELATTDKMDVDEPEPLASIPSIPGRHPSPLAFSDLPVPARAPSCPAKRPLTFIADDDDKRRRVVESMAVDDIDATFTDEPAAFAPLTMSASAPTLPAAHPTMIGGHVVKTSDTHPLVISPFLPTDILPTLGKYLVAPTHGREQPIMLGSEIDVPSLLLSCAAAHQCPSEAGPVGSGCQTPGPKTLIFNQHRQVGTRRPTNLGNLLLSSCPGKRLRMDGPVKGRGPVCRDLATDMRRIKSTGTDAIVCCLDDEELRLLGVPWEQYREVASEVGLDVIRLPMPDGFTPVSLQLFDAQVSLIVTKYTLRGINVLVHCRGGIGRAGLTACAWAIKMGFVQPHPSLAEKTKSQPQPPQPKHKSKSRSAPCPVVPAQEEERAIVMSIVERSIAMIRSRRGLKAIETMEQVQFLATYVTWLRESLA